MLPLDELREALMNQRRRLFQRVARVEDDLRWLDLNVEPEIEEEGQEANIARLLSRLDDRGQAEIAAIDEALARMARGEYGRCEACGQALPVERLRAVPTATRCVPCSGRT